MPHALLALILIFLLPVALFIAYLILSSCLGDTFRARLSRNGLPEVSYGRTYARSLGGVAGGMGGEQIEMQDMLDGRRGIENDDEWERGR